MKEQHKGNYAFQFHKGTIKTNYERSHQSWTYISIP